ncbi:hypothetical protein GJAV_G00206400 [Gymnothorax javanicus]|nr:hypothetical protein GJAV_G00206400 [Gymnothorax javanicus]
MAEGGGLLNQEQFSCSICLDLLKDPVTVPCGHSFCMDCIKGCWDRDDHTGVYSCPQCRQTFTPRPVLGRATILAEVIEKLKETGLQAAPPADCCAGPGDVECDICTGRKCKAVKSCLVCLASYCETHLQTHYVSPALKKHKLAKATGNLQEKICSLHDKLLEVYCRADQQCICLLCVMDEHRGHDTVSAAAERIDKQKRLGATQSKFQQRIQEREKELQDLRQAVQSLKRSAQAAVQDSERIFTELIRSIERRRSEVKELIRDQEKAEVSRIEGLLERLEQEIAELRRRDAELEQLSHSEDHIHFLQSFESLCAPSEPGDLPSITVSPHNSFEAVRKSVTELQERLEDVFKSELIKVSGKVGEVNVLVQELKTRKDFIQSPVDPPAGERDAECVIVWEKKPTPEEQERVARLQLPPTFFCGVGSDEGEKDKPEDFETELRKAQEDLAQQKRTEGSEIANPVVSSSSDGPAAEEQASPQPNSSSEATPAPSCPAQDIALIDPSTKKGPETEPDSTSQEPTTVFGGFGGFGSFGGFSFADLAKNTSNFAFEKQAPVDPPARVRDAECVIVWEKKPTPEEQERAARLQLPPTFFCGIGSDEGEKDKPEDFETELRKAQEDLKRTEGSEIADPVVSSSSDAPAAEEQASPQPDSSSEATPAPSCPAQDSALIDPSARKGPETEPDSTSQEPTTAFGGFGRFGSLGGFSFADLTKNTSDFALGKQDANFTWANAGTTVFGAAPATQTEADQPGSDEEEAASSADIPFEPVVSLPEVETKFEEEDEEILFNPYILF